MSRFLDWLDHRTGCRAAMHAALYEHIPGGPRWRYVWGSTLSFCFFVQVVTGLILWASYSPSAQTAWESVYYIQHQMTGGWLLRGVHHFTAQAMIVLLAIHFVQVVVDGAYRAPREINFWLGLILMQIVLALALTGYLLPWDQKGYWATKVATNMMSLVPVIGTPLQRMVVGGAEYGHHTLTRFFALHAGVLPAVLMIFLGLHVLLFRRHGLTVRDPNRAPDTTFWPEQLLRDGADSGVDAREPSRYSRQRSAARRISRRRIGCTSQPGRKLFGRATRDLFSFPLSIAEIPGDLSTNCRGNLCSWLGNAVVVSDAFHRALGTRPPVQYRLDFRAADRRGCFDGPGMARRPQ
jgi:hypothetical protein